MRDATAARATAPARRTDAIGNMTSSWETVATRTGDCGVRRMRRASEPKLAVADKNEMLTSIPRGFEII